MEKTRHSPKREKWRGCKHNGKRMHVNHFCGAPHDHFNFSNLAWHAHCFQSLLACHSVDHKLFEDIITWLGQAAVAEKCWSEIWISLCWNSLLHQTVRQLIAFVVHLASNNPALSQFCFCHSAHSTNCALSMIWGRWDRKNEVILSQQVQCRQSKWTCSRVWTWARVHT